MQSNSIPKSTGARLSSVLSAEETGNGALLHGGGLYEDSAELCKLRRGFRKKPTSQLVRVRLLSKAGGVAEVQWEAEVPAQGQKNQSIYE